MRLARTVPAIVTGRVGNLSGIGRPVYLVQGQELNNIGSDGESLLDITGVKIIKKLEPNEFFSNELGEDWNLNI